MSELVYDIFSLNNHLPFESLRRLVKFHVRIKTDRLRNEFEEWHIAFGIADTDGMHEREILAFGRAPQNVRFVGYQMFVHYRTGKQVLRPHFVHHAVGLVEAELGTKLIEHYFGRVRNGKQKI